VLSTSSSWPGWESVNMPLARMPSQVIRRQNRRSARLGRLGQGDLGPQRQKEPQNIRPQDKDAAKVPPPILFGHRDATGVIRRHHPRRSAAPDYAALQPTGSAPCAPDRSLPYSSPPRWWAVR
jgi:hypothetical protein